jgi:hypothetical protein
MQAGSLSRKWKEQCAFWSLRKLPPGAVEYHDVSIQKEIEHKMLGRISPDGKVANLFVAEGKVFHKVIERHMAAINAITQSCRNALILFYQGMVYQ